MPVVPDLARPGWRKLVDADGVPLARFWPEQRDGAAIADLLELEVPVERAVPVILAELRGMRVAGPEPLGRALVAAGGVPGRHAHVYSHYLRSRPAVPDGFGLGPVDRGAEALVDAYVAAHPPGHVDAGADGGAFLSRLLAGAYGRVLDCSGLAVSDGRVVGAILVAEVDGPFAGPWVMELFRAPGAWGAGRALLARALALCEGPALGLAVTHGNPAERLYVELGFTRVLTSFSVDL